MLMVMFGVLVTIVIVIVVDSINDFMVRVVVTIVLHGCW